MWWSVLVILAIDKWRHKDQEFKVILNHVASSRPPWNTELRENPSQNTHRVGWLSLSQVFDPEEHRASSMFFSYWEFDVIVIYTEDATSINPRHRMTEACSRPFRELWPDPKPQSIQQFVVLLFWNRVSRGPGWPWTCSVAIPASCSADHEIQGFMWSRQVLY